MGLAALAAPGRDAAPREFRQAIGTRDWARGLSLAVLALAGPTAELAAELARAGAGERAVIAELLAARGDRIAAPALRAAVRKEGSNEARVEELRALVTLAGDDGPGEALAKLARLPLRGQIRVAAALATAGVPEGIDVLNAALRSECRYDRYFAAEGLAESGQPAAERGLLRAIEDKSRWVRQAAIAGLGRAGTKKALPALRRIAKGDGERYLRSEARWAIGRITER
jgi:hypothetical protein